jgi:hypothetical protein
MHRRLGLGKGNLVRRLTVSTKARGGGERRLRKKGEIARRRFLKLFKVCVV